MNQNSKYSDATSEASELRNLLLTPIQDGRDIVRLSRLIMKKYVASGFSPDDVRIEIILGIESETDTMSLFSSASSEFAHIYDIYAKPFEECREEILSTL